MANVKVCKKRRAYLEIRKMRNVGGNSQSKCKLFSQYFLLKFGSFYLNSLNCFIKIYWNGHLTLYVRRYKYVTGWVKPG